MCSLQGAIAFSDPAQDRVEIDGLLRRVDSSQCRFYRNGSGYSGHEAAQHLSAKLSVASKRIIGELTADQFITEIASTSSLSGRPYMIDCGAVSQPLSNWLTLELARMRNN